MKHPKKADMIPFMGKKCRFVKGELHRCGGRKKVKGKEVDEFSYTYAGYPEETPIKWKTDNFTPTIGFTFGWIVGFGFCFDGAIIKQGFGDGAYKFFKATKRIDYVRVRLTPTSKEIKVLAKNINKVYI